ncbi:MAG: hypothetical protein OHK0013_00560 [Sandaracinaceae bacterium]
MSNKRAFASVEKSHRKVIRAAFEEAPRRDPRHRRPWVVLVDGDPTGSGRDSDPGSPEPKPARVRVLTLARWRLFHHTDEIRPHPVGLGESSDRRQERQSMDARAFFAATTPEELPLRVRLSSHRGIASALASFDPSESRLRGREWLGNHAFLVA